MGGGNGTGAWRVGWNLNWKLKFTSNRTNSRIVSFSVKLILCLFLLCIWNVYKIYYTILY